MALIKCPECGKEVSSTIFKCTNCGFTISKPRRGITGTIFKVLFVIFNAIMIFLSAIMAYGISNANIQAEGVKATMGMTSFGTIIFVWILIGLPLGIMNYITRPKAYE